MNRNFINRFKVNGTIVYLISVGFFSILGQVVILRELNVAFYGIELIYILSFGFWLIGTAIGAAAGRRSFIPKEKNIQMLFLLSALMLMVDIVFIRGLRKIFGSVEGAYLPFTIQLTGLVIALVPVSILAGLLFQWSAKVFVGESETLAKAYAIESAGGVIGGLCSTILLDLGISNFSIALICSFGCIFVTIYSLRERTGYKRYLSFVAIIIILFMFLMSSKIDALMTSWNHPFFIESIDTPYSRVTITSPEKQVCVFEDDALSYETESVSAEEFVHLSTLQTDTFNNVLVLGGGFGGILTELLKLPVNKIDYVEINKGMIDALQKYLPEELGKSLRNEKVTVIYTDPRKYLQSLHLYDIILVGMPEPMSAQNNRFYTKEFFAQCSESLNEKGILAFKIRSSENLWTKQLTERNKGIYNALKLDFENVIVLPGVVNIFIASNSNLTVDTKTLIRRLNNRKLETRLVSPQYINYIFTNDRFEEIKRTFSAGTNYINSDLHPVCYGYTIAIWLSKFFPGLAYSESSLIDFKTSINPVTVSIIIVLILGIILIITKSKQWRRFILVFVVGFAGMILEIVLILLYQNKNGILYRDIGFLITAFMVGLSIGAFYINKLFLRVNNKFNLRRLMGILLLICFSLLNLLAYLLIKFDLMNGLFIIFTALFLNGMCVAGIFSFAGLNKVENQQLIISPLYAADLIGGSLGSLVASLILIPVYGLLISTLLAAVLAICSLILIL